MAELTAQVNSSLGMTIPGDFAREVGINPNSRVLVRRLGAAILISAPRETSLLDELLSQVDETNLHGETDTGPSVGREAV